MLVEYTIPNQKSYKIAIVGEAPGKDEVALGRGFVGKSGKLLDKVLNQASINREKCIVANVFRIRPNNNKLDEFFVRPTIAREQGVEVAELPLLNGMLLMAEYLDELEHLAKTLQKTKPKIILACGATACWALTGITGITKLRGKLFECKMSKKSVVVPCYHPSYVLRNINVHFPLFLEDIIYVKEISTKSRQELKELCET